MKTSNMTRMIVTWLVLAMTATGCGLIPSPVIPLARTSVPDARTNFPQGHWEGDSPSVAFDLTADGRIHDFQLVGTLPLGQCTITVDEIALGATGKFEYGQAGNSPIQLMGEWVSPTVFRGIYKIKLCPGTDGRATVVLNPEDKPWTAELTEKAVGAAAAPSARARTAPTETPRPANTPKPVETNTPSITTVKAMPTATPTALPQSNSLFGSWQRITTLPRQINAFALDPANPQIVYAATGDNGSGSGVYKSEDRGRTWRNTSQGLPNEDVTALAFGQTTPFTLYALVGYQDSVYASSDNAASWTSQGKTGMTGIPWHRLVTVPGNNNALFALSLGNYLARSMDGGHAWTPIRRGIPSDENYVRVQAIAIDPSNPKLLYAGIGGFVGGGAGVFKSTDGGTNWSPANQGMLDYRIMALALDPQHPQTVYAGSDGGELFRSKDRAETWEDLTDNLPFARHQHKAIRQILVDSNSPNIIYLLCDQVGVVMTSDGGTTWNSLAKPPEGDSFYIHNAAIVLFGIKPVILLGDERSGAWRYAAQ